MLGKNLILPARFAATATAPRPPSAETYTLHFKIANSLVLIEAVINRQPARLIFDTGSTKTILSTEILGINPAAIARRQRQQFPYGVEPDHAIENRVSFVLDRLEIAGTLVLAADLAEVSRRLQMRCDGIIGQDVLSLFNSIRIDYRSNILQLEK
jgi:hypothetical protein